MGLTSPWNLPYPAYVDHTRTWEYWQALAEASNTALSLLKGDAKKGIPTIQTGSVSVPVAGTAASQTVTFPQGFAVVPNLAFNPSTNNTAIIGWIARGITISSTSFTIALNGPSATSTFVVQWTGIVSAVTPLALAVPDTTDDEGWHRVTATCHNPSCPSDGIAIPDVYVPDVPEDWGWTGIHCGACGQIITDIVPTP